MSFLCLYFYNRRRKYRHDVFREFNQSDSSKAAINRERRRQHVNDTLVCLWVSNYSTGFQYLLHSDCPLPVQCCVRLWRWSPSCQLSHVFLVYLWYKYDGVYSNLSTSGFEINIWCFRYIYSPQMCWQNIVGYRVLLRVCPLYWGQWRWLRFENIEYSVICGHIILQP